MRRSLPLFLVLSTAAAGLALSAPATAGASPSPVPVAPSTDRAHEAVPDQLLVGYVHGASATDRERARGRARAVRQDDVVVARPDRAAVELVRIPQGSDREQAIADLTADRAVAYAEPDWLLSRRGTPTDPSFTDGSLWGLKSAAATVGVTEGPANEFGTAAVEAWKTTTGTDGV